MVDQNKISDNESRLNAERLKKIYSTGAYPIHSNNESIEAMTDDRSTTYLNLLLMTLGYQRELKDKIDPIVMGDHKFLYIEKYIRRH